MILTVQMIRDKLGIIGPSTLWDLEAALGVTTARDAQVMVNTVHEALEVEAIKAKVIKIEFSEHVLYMTEWKG